MPPLAIDLFCGLGGWTEGLLAEGWDVVGFDIERHVYGEAGRHIPLVVENVRGAQPWVGRSRWSFGSFHLWGDVPAFMPSPSGSKIADMPPLSGHADPRRGRKNTGGSWFNIAHNTTSGRKQGGDWFAEARKGGGGGTMASFGSKSPARKFASAMIAKIPLALSRHIARTYKP